MCIRWAVCPIVLSCVFLPFFLSAYSSEWLIKSSILYLGNYFSFHILMLQIFLFNFILMSFCGMLVFNCSLFCFFITTPFEEYTFQKITCFTRTTCTGDYPCFWKMFEIIAHYHLNTFTFYWLSVTVAFGLFLISLLMTLGYMYVFSFNRWELHIFVKKLTNNIDAELIKLIPEFVPTMSVTEAIISLLDNSSSYNLYFYINIFLIKKLISEILLSLWCFIWFIPELFTNPEIIDSSKFFKIVLIWSFSMFCIIGNTNSISEFNIVFYIISCW